MLSNALKQYFSSVAVKPTTAATPQSPLPGFDASQFASQAASGQSFSGNPAFSGKVSGAVAGITAGKTVTSILGEITRLMAQSGKHKNFMIGDLEWQEKRSNSMPAVLLRQLSLYCEKGIAIIVVIFANVLNEVLEWLDGRVRLATLDELGSGETGRVMVTLAPFGGEVPL